MQAEGHIQHDLPATQTPFEDAVAILKFALCGRHSFNFTTADVQHCHCADQIAHLDSVGANILNWCGTHTARNQSKVFQSVIAVVQTVLHKAMPALTAGGTHEQFALAFSQHFDAWQGHLHHDTGIVGAQQHVTATTEHQQWHLPYAPELQCYPQLLQTAHRAEIAGMGPDAEGIAGAEIDILLDERWNKPC